MSKFVGYIQVLVEADDRDSACRIIADTLRNRFVAWQYLAPGFPDPCEVSEKAARDFFLDYGAKTAAPEKEAPNQVDFLALTTDKGFISLYAVSSQAQYHIGATACEGLPTRELVDKLTDGFSVRDITGVDFLYRDVAGTPPGAEVLSISDRAHEAISTTGKKENGWCPLHPRAAGRAVHRWINDRWRLFDLGTLKFLS